MATAKNPIYYNVSSQRPAWKKIVLLMAERGGRVKSSDLTDSGVCGAAQGGRSARPLLKDNLLEIIQKGTYQLTAEGWRVATLHGWKKTKPWLFDESIVNRNFGTWGLWHSEEGDTAIVPPGVGMDDDIVFARLFEMATGMVVVEISGDIIRTRPRTGEGPPVQWSAGEEGSYEELNAVALQALSKK